MTEKFWLSPANKKHLEDLVREVLITAYYDDAGVTTQYLIDKAKIAAEILIMNVDEKGDDIEAEDE